MSTLTQDLDVRIVAQALNNFTWMHVSDLHFGHGPGNRYRADQEIVTEQIVRDSVAIKKRLGQLDAIFVTGDIAFRADPTREYVQGKKWIDDLAAELHLDPRQVFAVPGNHDIDRRAAAGSFTKRSIHANLRNNVAGLDDLLASPEDLGQIWNKLAPYSHSMTSYGAPQLTPSQPFYSVRLSSPLGNIEIIGLNTALLSYDDADSPSNLALGLRQIHRAIVEKADNCLLMVLMHHPPEWLTDGDQLETFLQTRPHILLSGHIHRQAGRVMLPLSGHGLVRLAAGAGHLESTASPTHAYSWGRISAIGLEYFPRVWVPELGSFTADRNRFERIEANGGVLFPLDKLPDALRKWLPPLQSKLCFPLSEHGAVKWIRDPMGGYWLLRSEGNVNELSTTRIERLVKEIRAIAEDMNVSLITVASGSVNLLFYGSDRGYQNLQARFDEKKDILSSALGMNVVELLRVNGATLEASAERTSGPNREFQRDEYMLAPTKPISAPTLKAVVRNEADAANFSLILDAGESDKSSLDKDLLKNYFRASMNLSSDNWWVNLSAYESNRMIPPSLAKTEAGRDLLAQDCTLKRLAASLVHPDSESGQKFWSRVMNSFPGGVVPKSARIRAFQKIWIRPKHILVYNGIIDDELIVKWSILSAHKGQHCAIIVESSLEVMCERDLTAIDANQQLDRSDYFVQGDGDLSNIVDQAYVREILPIIDEEVNRGDLFVPLRQIYHAMALAIWVKKQKENDPRIKKFIDLNKPECLGINISSDLNEEYYEQYLDLFKRGIFRCNMSVCLGNPVVTFFWSAAMLLTGIVIGAYWHPSRALVVAAGITAGIFMVLHELLCCFVWCSLSAWWIGRRTGELKDGRQK